MNQSLDTLIGMDTHINAVDIAVLMKRNQILDILEGKGLKGVRHGGTIACGVH